jgi:hypothetical protein
VRKGFSLPDEDLALRYGLDPSAIEAAGLSYPDARTKVGGVPETVSFLGGHPQGFDPREALPECPTCRSTMALLAQLGEDESGDGPDLWDPGLAFLFVCRAHPSTVALRVRPNESTVDYGYQTAR